MSSAEEPKPDRRWVLLAAPVAVCLPCLAPLVVAGVLAAMGAGTIASSFTENGLLLAAAATFIALVVIVTTAGLTRLLTRRRRYADEHHKG